MEPIFLICIGAGLFAHGWYAMGMYSDGRTTGIIVGALGAGALISLTVDPVLMGAETTGALRAAEVNVFRTLVVFWGNLRRSDSRPRHLRLRQQGDWILRHPARGGQHHRRLIRLHTDAG